MEKSLFLKNFTISYLELIILFLVYRGRKKTFEKLIILNLENLGRKVIIY